MSVSSENPASPLLAQPSSSRPVQELAVTVLFAPPANALARALARTRLSPPAVVVVHGLVGLVAAGLLAGGSFAAAACLLQVRTLLDNVDGRLARISGRVTLTGRYLDTVVDFVVNLALFAALAVVTGSAWLALAAFVALTLVLAVDFNVSQLYRETRGEATASSRSCRSGIERLLGAFYRVVFAPQDRLIQAVVRSRLERALGSESDPERRRRATRVYHDRATVSVLANLGLSTQHLALGAALLLDTPAAYLWLVLGSLALVPVLQARRERLARRALAE
ncbi:MAG: CDP-alcohol phosphatidyltransferase [Gaiellaceae bacterium]|jgi:archaetidylinositol phosphate synthase|nr:MAG: CDP-alcohol phosphatidyltransferase [Gaiellaceae bacterium]